MKNSSIRALIKGMPKGVLFLILLCGATLQPTFASGVKVEPRKPLETSQFTRTSSTTSGGTSTEDPSTPIEVRTKEQAITETGATAFVTSFTTNGGITTKDLATSSTTAAENGETTTENILAKETTTWVTTTTSSPSLVNIRSQHETKRSTDARKLTADMCSSNDSIRDIVGVFATYIIADIRGNNDEGGITTFVCGKDNDVVKECQEYVMSTLQDVRLAINGAIQQESSVPSKLDPDTNNMDFNLTLEYESHLNANITCVNVLSEQANLTSSIYTIDKVDELHEFLITPETTEITVGESYTLTCQVDSSRALEQLFWTRAINSGQEKGFKCTSETFCEKSRYDDPPSEVLVFSTNETKNAKETTSYTYWCTVRPLRHEKQRLAKAYVSVLPEDRRLFNALIWSGAALVVVVVLVIAGLYIRKRRTMAALAVSIRMTEARNAIMVARQTSNEYEGERRDDQSILLIETVNDIMARISRKHSAWERDKQSLTIKQQIGVGNFGCVFSGTMPDEMGIIQTVAIKTIKEQGLEVAALLDYEKEMDFMTNLRHRNIVNLLGICTVSLPFYIIMEYMVNGPLNTYLVDFAPSRDKPLGGLTVAQLAWICQQPCDALDYMITRSMVHRDVSARNCLVGMNLQVKLADFGLSRDTSDNAKNYYKKEGGMVPVKWMAPEALTYGKYTSANDVWAFGVLAWEVFSFGALPYQHLMNQQVIIDICKGERLERPHLCPQGLWDVILQCWADAPDERVMLSALLAFFKEYSQGCAEAAQR